jgi:hypothetical protein
MEHLDLVESPSPGWYIWRLTFFLLTADKVDKGTIKLLSHFMSTDHLSVYQLFKAEKLANEKLHYKSTHKAFQRLVDLKLVERIESDDSVQLSEKELTRSPKYYRLSEEGLFTLYLKNKTYFPHPSIIKVNGGKRQMKLIDLSKSLLSRYRRYEFYRHCLYPWIEYDTIASCSPQFARKVNDSLSDICIFMEKSLRYFYNKHVFSQLSKEMNALEGGIAAGEKDDKIPLISLAEKIGSFEEQEKEDKGDGKRRSLPPPALTLKQRAIAGQISFAILREAESFDLKPLYYRVMFSLVIGEMREGDKKLLEKDTKFKRILDEVNTQFKNNYTALK